MIRSANLAPSAWQNVSESDPAHALGRPPQPPPSSRGFGPEKGAQIGAIRYGQQNNGTRSRPRTLRYGRHILSLSQYHRDNRTSTAQPRCNFPRPSKTVTVPKLWSQHPHGLSFGPALPVIQVLVVPRHVVLVPAKLPPPRDVFRMALVSNGVKPQSWNSSKGLET